MGDASGLLAVIASATPMLLNMQYSRSFETEADEKGYELLHAARINPAGLVTFFEKLIAEQEKMLEKIDDPDTAELLDTVSGFLSSHPATEQRIAHIQQLAAADRNNYRDLNYPFKQLKDLVKDFVTDNASDQTDPQDQKE